MTSSCFDQIWDSMGNNSSGKNGFKENKSVARSHIEKKSVTRFVVTVKISVNEVFKELLIFSTRNLIENVKVVCNNSVIKL